MAVPDPYLPQNVFAPQVDGYGAVPRVLIAPQRYVQGDGIIRELGRYLSLVPSERASILISAGGQRRIGPRIIESLRAAGIESVVATFQGECSVEEVERVAATLRAASPPVDSVVAVGGGKCVDAGKCVAFRLGIPAVVVPTLASNDAPCSALSVMYAPSGVFTDIEFFPASPTLVAVDTRLVAEAPLRYLVAGMGDAMATWYEARTCLDNPNGRSCVGARPTLAASAIGEICAATLYAHGEAAAEAVKRSKVTDALERVVEANTLLSGIGFESGGLAVAHAAAQAFTVVPEVHRRYLHGEMVAIGLLTQLTLENNAPDARRVAEFFVRVGLPVHLEQLSVSPGDAASLKSVIETALMHPAVPNEPFIVTPKTLLGAVLDAHALGKDVCHTAGDVAYRALHEK